MRRFSNSELRTWKRCRRKWWLSYYRRLRWNIVDTAGKPMTLGTRVHRALEIYYDPSAWSDGEPADACLRALHDSIAADIAKRPDQETEILDEAALAVLMIEGYLE